MFNVGSENRKRYHKEPSSCNDPSNPVTCASFFLVMHKDKEENSHHDSHYRARELAALAAYDHHHLDGEMFLQKTPISQREKFFRFETLLTFPLIRATKKRLVIRLIDRSKKEISILVSGIERFSADINLRRGGFLCYPQHRELPWLSSGKHLEMISNMP
ncbi:Aryl hydrocarbon receptor [Vespula squamosa]|uniref:Aryl hydrocarbon receptor n=1 Tax=Vespula squamosa TaxID=30214 RepID=A0ABD2B7J9_VESSQ